MDAWGGSLTKSWIIGNRLWKSSTRDDIPIHRRQHAEQLIARCNRGMGSFHGLHQITDDDVEHRRVDVEAFVGFRHAASFVGTRATGKRTQLIDHVTTKGIYVGVFKRLRHTRVITEVANKRIYDLLKARFTIEFGIERRRRFAGRTTCCQEKKRHQAWEPRILQMLRVVEITAMWSTGKIGAIRGPIENTTEHVRRCVQKIYSHELVNLIFEQPYCRIANVTEAGLAKRQTASLYLKQLVDVGVLAEAATSKEKLFVHQKFMRLLTRESNELQRFWQTLLTIVTITTSAHL